MSTRAPRLVLHVLPHPGGGGEEYVRLLEAMEEFRFQRIYLTRDMSPRAAIASVPRVAAAARQCELIHVHGDSAALVCLPILRLRPALLTTHGLSLLRRSTGATAAVVRRALRSAVARSVATICTSEAERDELRSLVADAGTLHVVLNGITIRDAETPVADRAELRRALGLELSDFAVAWVGALEAHKDPLTFARAVADAGPPVVGVMAGAGSMADELAPIAGDRVRMLGHRDDLDQILPACDAFAITSEREGGSLAILDAMAWRLPVIASDGPGNPEAVGHDGMVVPVGDDAALAAALRRLAASPELREDLGRRARARVERLYDVRRTVAATRDLYERALR